MAAAAGSFGGRPFPNPLNLLGDFGGGVAGFGGRPFPNPLNFFSSAQIHGKSFGGRPFPNPLNSEILKATELIQFWWPTIP